MSEAKTLADRNEELNNMKPGGHVRWMICALLCCAIIVIYIHRNAISVLKGTFADEFGWDEKATEKYWGYLGMVFTGAYAVGMVFAGRILDRIGVRKTFMIAALVWSLIAIGHGWIGKIHNATAISALLVFILFRLALGSVEGTFFPASIRGVTEWFPKRERAYATGLFNAGACIGAILTPWLAPHIVHVWNWPMVFYMAGGLGLVWVVAWMIIYREPDHHPLVSPAELDYIRSDRAVLSPMVPWARIMEFPQTWAFAIGKFLTDPIWWFYIFWIPGILAKLYHLHLDKFGPPLIAIYLMSDLGSIAGGWLSSMLMRQGKSVNVARKTAMLVCALCVLPIVAVPWISNLTVATLIIGLAAAAHQGWSANLFTLASDMSPRSAVGSVVGFGGMCGAIGSMLFQVFIGYVVAWTSLYTIPLIMAGIAYLITLGIIHHLAPRLEPMELNDGPAAATANPI